MLEWLRKRRHEVAHILESKQTLPPLPVKAHKHVPPIVLRIGYEETINDDTNLQFLCHGWRYGRDTTLTHALDRLIYEGANNEGKWISLSAIVAIPNGYHVRAVQIAQHENIDYYGEVLIGLYIPADAALGLMERTSLLVGGPTAEMLMLAQYLAMRFESRIISMETDLAGDVLILFAPWNKQYTLENYYMRWQEEPVARVWQHGPLDDSNGKVANSEGS